MISKQEHILLYVVTFIGLTKNRDELYEGINQRVDIMFEMGLMKEVEYLLRSINCHSNISIDIKPETFYQE